MESWYFGRCYDDSCVRGGLIDRQWACPLARPILTSPENLLLKIQGRIGVPERLSFFGGRYTNATHGRAIVLHAEGQSA